MEMVSRLFNQDPSTSYPMALAGYEAMVVLRGILWILSVVYPPDEGSGMGTQSAL